MKKYLVTRIVKFTKVIEADNKNEALEIFGDLNADFMVIKETAKLVKGEIKRV